MINLDIYIYTYINEMGNGNEDLEIISKFSPTNYFFPFLRMLFKSYLSYQLWYYHVRTDENGNGNGNSGLTDSIQLSCTLGEEL